MQYFSRTFMLNLLLKLKWFIKSIKKVFCFIKCESYKICAIFYFCKNYFCKNKKQQPKKQLSHHSGLCSTVQKPEAEDGWAQRLAMWFPLSVSRWQNALRDKERPSICSWRGSFSRHIAASLPHLGDFSVKYIKATFSLIPMLRFFLQKVTVLLFTWSDQSSEEVIWHGHQSWIPSHLPKQTSQSLIKADRTGLWIHPKGDEMCFPGNRKIKHKHLLLKRKAGLMISHIFVIFLSYCGRTYHYLCS